MLRRLVPLIFWAVNFTGQLTSDLGFRSNLGMGTFRFRERERERVFYSIRPADPLQRRRHLLRMADKSV